MLNDVESIDDLIKLGVDVNPISKSGQTPIIYAASKGHEEVCQDKLNCLILILNHFFLGS